jgi:hypothetical protein
LIDCKNKSRIYDVLIGWGEMHSKHRGAHSELTACLWLLEQGYEVFRNISQHGIVDVVAFRGDEILKIDVKTLGPPSVRGRPLQKPEQAGVAFVYVRNGDCELDLKPRHQRGKKT